jgi:hypothetical protein
MSFADGVVKGYGLVQNTMNAAEDRAFRKEQQGDLRNYRAQTLGIQQQQADDLATYRDQNLSLQRDVKTMDHQYRVLKAAFDAQNQERDDGNAAITAQAALVRAETDAGESAQDLADAKDITDGKILNNIFEIAQSGDTQRRQNRDLVSSYFDQLEGSRLFPIDTIMSTDFNVHSQELSGLIESMATGQNVQINQPQLAALTDIMSINNTKAIGSKVDSQTFPNAPAEYEGYTIRDINLADLEAVGGKIRGSVSVELEDPNGGSVFYYPTLTEFRGGNTAQLEMEPGEAMQAMYGRTMMYNNLLSNTVFKEEVNNYKVDKRGGADKVKARTASEVKRVTDLLAKNDSNQANALFIENNDLQGLVMPGENPADLQNKLALLEERAERRYLYGTPTESKVSRAQDYAAQLRGLMPQVNVDTGDRSLKSSGANSRQTVRGNGIVSLSELIGDVNELNPNQMAHINAMINNPDDMTIPAAKFERLQQYLINQGLMARP